MPAGAYSILPVLSVPIFLKQSLSVPAYFKINPVQKKVYPRNLPVIPSTGTIPLFFK